MYYAIVVKYYAIVVNMHETKQIGHTFVRSYVPSLHFLEYYAIVLCYNRQVLCDSRQVLCYRHQVVC